ncbi:MAG TPA: glycosyltransferase 87 family protein [Candidatus Dormibacteraeota bacterium]|nr:glycosyltransferase 87 family protein [Candidatus Dormibacteraeota bacterium]
MLAAALAGGGALIEARAGVFNDFFDYWGAARLLAAGGNAYDKAAVGALQRAAGLEVTTGDGFSYPLLFARLLRPLAALPPWTAGLWFSAASLLALAAAVALLAPLAAGGRGDRRRTLAFAVAAAVFAPALGSLYFGQANLLVLLPLALAAAAPPAARAIRPLGLALATSVKLFPATALAALATRPRRLGEAAGGAVLAAALIGLPALGARSAGGGLFLSLLKPDPYWTNQSVNGWLSRLAYPTQWTDAMVPGLPVAALDAAAICLLTLGVAAVLLTHRRASPLGAISLGLCLGAACAPKNSLWNLCPLLVALAYAWPRAASRQRWLLAGGYLMIELQGLLAPARQTVYHALPGLGLLASLGLYGALLIGAVTASVVAAESPADDVDRAQVEHPAVVGVDRGAAERGLHRQPG